MTREYSERLMRKTKANICIHPHLRWATANLVLGKVGRQETSTSKPPGITDWPPVTVCTMQGQAAGC